MVAYSFKARFAPPILAGTKRQTIRAPRKRHARVGEECQLYTGMRTKNCKLITRATCAGVGPIRLEFDFPEVRLPHALIRTRASLDAFAMMDGFEDWSALHWFWREEHGDPKEFEGVIITWKALA